ncbi:MAG TPA: GNAT family N-acetyltransferase [Longimicrobiaceae bacterium]|nr:GNAT family N-acetyltransferase [Longimicrobiaceae bacterium]
MSRPVRVAATDEEVLRCFPVLLELRPHLLRDEFLPRIRRMQEEGFLLAFLEEEGEVRAVAGYRYMDLLFSGRTLYVDDLVTDPRQRSRGHGEALLGWLREQARERGCATLTLDSGVQRAEAHRFYFRQRMSIQGYHFSLPLEPPGD